MERVAKTAVRDKGKVDSRARLSRLLKGRPVRLQANAAVRLMQCGFNTVNHPSHGPTSEHLTAAMADLASLLPDEIIEKMLAPAFDFIQGQLANPES